MRVRKLLINKLFVLIIFIILVILFIFNYVIKTNDNEFLTITQTENQNIHENFLNAIETNNLLNLTNFTYLLTNKVCQQYNKDLLALLIVTSYVGHDELRAAHRQAITQLKLAELGMQRIFLLAAIPSTEKFITQKQLENEQLRFGDLLQGNFEEAYRNLSYKHVMGLRWAALNCTFAKFIVKLDDDIVYDVFQLRRHLETLEMQQLKTKATNELLAGYILDAKPAIRNVANKWYVTKQEYPHALYPSYLSGWLYITNVQTALRLVKEAYKTTYFWIDDTWITGILRARLKIPIQKLNMWYSANSQFLECCVRDLKEANYECEYFVGPNGGNSKLIIEFLHNVEKCYFDECIKRPLEKALNRSCVAEVKHILPDHGEAIIKSIKLR